jgi:hypothetical protein
MEIIRKFPIFSFYYVVPLILGFGTGLCLRDNQITSVNKKISMSLADYYLETGENVNDLITKEFPDVEKLIKKIEKQKKESLE